MPNFINLGDGGLNLSKTFDDLTWTEEVVRQGTIRGPTLCSVSTEEPNQTQYWLKV